MKRLLSQLFSSNDDEERGRVHSSEGQPVSGQDDLLAQRNENQSLRMEIVSRDEKIEHLKQEIERLRYRQDALVEEGASTRIEALLGDLAGPAAQIRTQAALLEQGTSVQARDVLAVAARILRTLERAGLVFDGQAGEKTAYDPSRHTLLNAETEPAPGQLVTVQVAGVTYKGKVLYKGVVTACQDA